MKKSYLLSGMIVFGSVAGVNAAQGLTQDERRRLEQVQWGKIREQRELARPATYKMLDPLVEQRNWPAIFAMLDQMQGVISVNDYRDNMGFSLLHIAASKSQSSFLAVKTLLEKYKANPNLQVSSGPYKGWTSLEFACAGGDFGIVKLLLHHGANPHIKDSWGNDSFTYAKQHPGMVLLLQEYVGAASAE